MATTVLETLQQQLIADAGRATLSHGVLVLTLNPAELLPTVGKLRDGFGFDLFLDEIGRAHV